MITLTARSISKRFNRSWIIREFSGEFRGGEVVGIAGRNGSGKSTLLRMLGGQLSPSRGRVVAELEGKEIKAEDRYRSVVWTGPYLEVPEEMTVSEFLTFHYKFKPLLPGITADDLPERLDLGPARNRKLLECSSGMRQRVLLASALYADVPLVLLDEPTLTLDDTARAWFYGQLAEHRGDRLILLGSNDTEDLRHCDRVVTLVSGV